MLLVDTGNDDEVCDTDLRHDSNHRRVILIVALLVFGPRRLPEIGRSLGKGMCEFKDSITDKEEKTELPVPHVYDGPP